MTEADSDALAAGCIALAEALAANRADSWRRADMAWKRYWQCLQHFGMTPASRAKLSVPSDDGKDPLAEWEAKAAPKRSAK